MNEFIVMIKAWPIIVQGALGSFLFWIALNLGERLVNSLVEKYSHISKKARISWLRTAYIQNMIDLSGDNYAETTYGFSILIYKCLRHICSAMLWVVLGLLINAFISPFGAIGYIGALYYLLKAYQVVKPSKEDDNPEEDIKKIVDELDELDKT